MGPYLCKLNCGFKYYWLIIDEHNKYSWFFPLKAKSEIYSTFVTFKTCVEISVGNEIKILCSDSGGEFTSASLQSFLASSGILHQHSCPHTPEQCVERKYKHLMETVKTFLVTSQVPQKYRVEAFLTTIYLINRLPISCISKSP